MKALALLACVVASSGCVTANVHARFYKGEMRRVMVCLFEPGGPGVLPEAKCGPVEVMLGEEPKDPAPPPPLTSAGGRIKM